MPENSTSFVMTNLQETRSKMKQTLGNLYGLRTWVEYAFRQCKQELGWTNYRFTNFKDIEKMLARTAAEIGVDIDPKYHSHIQGKTVNNFNTVYDRSHAAMS